FVLILLSPRSTLFPYTTLFRSYFRNVPVGCTCTIIYQLYQETGVEIEDSTAGLMLSAILSDTLMFRSPTCTPADEKAARALAQQDRKSTRLNSSHVSISYAVFC